MSSVWLRNCFFFYLLRVSGCDCWSGQVECPTDRWNNCFAAAALTFKAHRHSVSSPGWICEVPGEVSPQTDERRVRCGFLYMVFEQVR